MKKNLLIYALLIGMFLIETLLFMAFHGNIYCAYGMDDWGRVLWHSLPHDVTVGGYFMIVPFLCSLLYVWVKGSWRDSFLRIYYAVCLPLLITVWLIDLILYGYWGFRLDCTPFLYFLDAPWVCISQAKWWEGVIVIVALMLVIWGSWKFSKLMYPLRRPEEKIFSTRGNKKTRLNTCIETVIVLLLCGALVIAIRGGVSVATMNVGRVYFSSEVVLNHAAVNPIFSLLYSFTKQEEKTAYYHFMEDGEAECIFNELMAQNKDSVAVEEPLLNTKKPNIVIIIFESFSGYMCHEVNPKADVNIMPTFNRLYNEAVGFDNMYCNAWRTDRGVTAVLAAYPAIAPYAVMKYQNKCDNLQFISKRLKENGYGLQFIHGGDVNFTNIKGFLTSGGFENIISDKDFPLSERISKWGAPDHIVFNKLYDEIQQSASSFHEKPFCKVMLTLSSHEPFDVPFHKLSDEFDNSVAYTDSCFGNFIQRLKNTDAWKNLLVIAVPDHSNGHPELYSHADPERFRIPMVWTGGSIATPRRIATIGQQTDIAATLFGQMGIAHDDFLFSKDMLDAHIPHFAFYSFSDGLGFITDTIAYVQDNERDGQPLFGLPDPHGNAARWGRAYLQHLCNDLSKR